MEDILIANDRLWKVTILLCSPDGMTQYDKMVSGFKRSWSRHEGNREFVMGVYIQANAWHPIGDIAFYKRHIHWYSHFDLVVLFSNIL